MNDNGFDVIGRSRPKGDVWGRIKGDTKYADDIVLPRMALAKLLRSPYPHARIKSVDTTRALALPGVFAVISGADFTPMKFGVFPSSQDEEPLCTETVRMVGDPVAAVAAVDEETADRACQLIDVEYEPLRPLFSIEDALTHPEVRIHHYGDGPNVHTNVAFEFGDVDAAFAAADLVLEDLFRCEGNTHLAIEQHSVVAQWGSDGTLSLWSSTQAPHHAALGRLLDVPTGGIRVLAMPVGGAFGGKLDLFAHEIVACRLSQLTGRPVKITLTREEVFYAHRGRHPALVWIKTGFTKNGEITGCALRVWLDGGAYASYGVVSTFYTGAVIPVTYQIPVYRFEAARIFTNKPPCGPKRAHGTPQTRFALECHLDKAAERLGLDPALLRRRMIVEPFTKTANHVTVTTVGLGECIDRVLEASRWFDKRNGARLAKAGGRPGRSRRKGIGIACSAYPTGTNTALADSVAHWGAIVRADRNGGVSVHCGSVDIGQGSDEVIGSLVAEVLGVERERVRVHPEQTELTAVDLGSYAARMTLMSGLAAIRAAEQLKERLVDEAAQTLAAPSASVVVRGGKIGVPDDWANAVSFARAAELAEKRHGILSFSASYSPPSADEPVSGGVGSSPCYSYTACVVELTVDVDTGAVGLDDVWIAHDIGRALNPVLAQGQIEGCVYMGIGEALMERTSHVHGLPKFPSMLGYKSPTTLEMPQVHTILVESADPGGPFGAKEVGQGPLLPVIPAIANAIFHATGVRIDEVPITPEKVLAALDRRRKGLPARVGPDREPEFGFRKPIVMDSGFGQPVRIASDVG